MRESGATVERQVQEQCPTLVAGQPEYRTLIVEDDPENAMVLEQVLLRAGEVFECMRTHLVVQYRQDSVAEAASTSREGRLLRPASLAALLHELRRDLIEAVVSLDRQRILPAIDRGREVDEHTASALSRLAEGLSYAAILSAVESLEQESAHESPGAFP